jgi:hypothetical protein
MSEARGWTVSYWQREGSAWTHRVECLPDAASADHRMRALGSLAALGDYCELTIWDVALTVDEIRALAGGCSSLDVRPSALQAYASIRPIQSLRAGGMVGMAIVPPPVLESGSYPTNVQNVLDNCPDGNVLYTQQVGYPAV